VKVVNKFNSRKPRYNDDSDYTTNAPTYYDDLARKNELIKYLAKRIWEYDKTLYERLEDIEDVLAQMIHKIGEGFNEEIRVLLVQWVEDGTLDHIINEVLFSELNKKIDDGLAKTNDKIDTGLEEMNDKIDTGLDNADTRITNVFNELNKKIVDILRPYASDDVSNSLAKEKFINLMNEKAKQYQMNNTTFVNPHGLNHPNQRTTAFDMLLLGMQATGYDKLMEVMGRRTHTSQIEGNNKRTLQVKTSVDQSSLNDSHLLVGAKTGTVTVDGNRIQNLVAIGQPKKEPSLFIGAVMNARPSRYTSMRHLFDIAQSSMKNKFDFKYHTNNLTNGNFDEGFSGWIRNGSPTPILNKEDYFMFPNAVDIGSYGTSSYLTRLINLIPGNIYYVNAYIKCTRYDSGYIGLQLSGDGATKNDRIQRTTRGWKKVSIRFIAETNSVTINVGGMENADLDGLVGGVNVINLTSTYGQGAEPSKEFMDSQQWRNISGGAEGAGIVAQVSPHSNAYDKDTIEILFEKNARVKHPPASLTKIMTAILLLDYEDDLSQQVEIIESDLTGGSGSMFDVGDIISLNDCLHHLMLESSNTIATVISRVIGKKVLLYEKLGEVNETN